MGNLDKLQDIVDILFEMYLELLSQVNGYCLAFLILTVRDIDQYVNVKKLIKQ